MTPECPVLYETRVLSVKGFYPAGEFVLGIERKQPLVQVWTDPGGFRTLSVWDIKKVR